jgi:hypothetical protein
MKQARDRFTYVIPIEAKVEDKGPVLPAHCRHQRVDGVDVQLLCHARYNGNHKLWHEVIIG